MNDRQPTPAEIWKDIEGYEGFYQVSNLGRVKSLARIFYSGRNKSVEQVYPEKPIGIQAYKSGYLYVVLCINAVAKKFKVHRLVAVAFVPNPDGKPHIDHINAVRNDNRAVNLRWCTQSENQHNPHTLKSASLAKIGDKNPMKRNMRAVFQFDAKTKELITVHKSAKNIPGFDSSCICRCCNGLLGVYRGCVWRYDGDSFDEFEVNRHKQNRAVLQFTKDGEFVAEYNSVIGATISVNGHSSGKIGDCCKGRQKSAYGFIWQYKNTTT